MTESSAIHARLIASARAAVCGLGTAVARDTSDSTFRLAIDGYELIREVGRGGQGVVFHATQQSTQRDVAIKVLRHGLLATPAEQARLEREVRILGQLRHPGIVTVHASGRSGNLSYVVMDYIDGVPLDEYVGVMPASIRERIALFAEIAEAVNAAHLRGVIHRDLKPANIRVDGDGVPHVLDFGVAKLMESDATATVLTESGQFIGSLRWAAPEQARGDHAAVDIRTDVYSLGVLFWYCLTGASPYPVVGGLRSILQNIATAEPVLSTAMRSTMPLDVETILRKCLTKEPERRYQTAGELAADLRAYLDGAPIGARRDSRIYVLRKTIARHRIVFGAAAVVFLTAVIASVALSVLYAEAEAARATSEIQRTAARRNAYYAGLHAAAAGLLADDVRTSRRGLELTPPELRGWEWYYLANVVDESRRSLRDHADVASGVAWSPEGDRLVTASFDKTLRLRDAEGTTLQVLDGHADIVFDVAWSPNGRRIASGGRDRTVRLWDATTGAPLHVWTAPERVTDLAFSPDGQRLAVAASYSQVVVVLDVDSHEEVLRLPRHGPLVQCVAFSPDGALLASGAVEYGGGRGEATIRIYDAGNGEVLNEFPIGSWGALAVAFSPDSMRIAAATRSDGAKIWSVAEPPNQPTRMMDLGRSVNDVAFSRDGDRLMSAGADGLLYISNSRTGARLDSFRGHEDGIGHLTLAPDDLRAATTAGDHTLKIWDLSKHPARTLLAGHQHGAGPIVFSSDGSRLVSGARDGDLRIWSTSDWAVTERREGFGIGGVMRMSPDGSTIVTVTLDPDGNGPEGAIHMWDSGRKPRLLADQLPSLHSAAISPDGRSLVVASARTGEVRSWDLRSGAVIEPPKLPDGVMYFTPSATGERIVAILRDNSALALDGRTWNLIHSFEVRPGDPAGSLLPPAISADGRFVAIASKTGFVTLFRTDSWEEVAETGERGAPAPSSLAFSPDGQRLAIGHTIGVTIADAATLEPLLTLRDVTNVNDVAFSPDGRHLLAASDDGTIRVWTAEEDAMP
ncbi:MAG: protein kinase [Phycisphaerae bacterium]